MPRERLPHRRHAVVLDLDYRGNRHHVAIGLYDDGRPGEVFVSGARTGSDVDGLLADLGVLISRALQHGDSLETLVNGMGRLGDGKTPASIIGSILDRVATEMRENASSESPPAGEGG